MFGAPGAEGLSQLHASLVTAPYIYEAGTTPSLCGLRQVL